MLSMLRLLSITLLLSSFAHAITVEKSIENFIKKYQGHRPGVILKEVKTRASVPVPGHTKWRMYLVDIKADVKNKAGVSRIIKITENVFSDGKLIAPNLIEISTDQNMKDISAPKMKRKFYRKANRIYVAKNAKHKLVLFSDPLCPHCMKSLPPLIDKIKSQPHKYALYLYHLPLDMHPAGKTITKCMIAAELKGYKDIAYKTYKADNNKPYGKGQFKISETNEKKILTTFNKVIGTKLTMREINDAKVLKRLHQDMVVVSEMYVTGTPTLFVNGKKDPNRLELKKILGK